MHGTEVAILNHAKHLSSVPDIDNTYRPVLQYMYIAQLQIAIKQIKCYKSCFCYLLITLFHLKLSATNISTTDNLLKFCIFLALVNVDPKQFKKYMVTMETIETGQIRNL